MGRLWDYVVLTASNDRQAEWYRLQIEKRRTLGLLSSFREPIVAADPKGKRLGSGGSTLFCLMEILNREAAHGSGSRGGNLWREILQDLRILIIHAGGDSKSLPAYSTCGKIFLPLPGHADLPIPAALFDKLVPLYAQVPLELGNILVARGDTLVLFDPEEVDFSRPGITALGARVSPLESTRHGVLHPGPGGSVRRFVQEPPVPDQQSEGARDQSGLSASHPSVFHSGVMSLSAEAAVALLEAFDAVEDEAGRIGWRLSTWKAVLSHGIDLYREICCALGNEATPDYYVTTCKESGSTWSEEDLRRMAERLKGIPFWVSVPESCRFLHFDTTRRLITSGRRLLQNNGISIGEKEVIAVNSVVRGAGAVKGGPAWLEGTKVQALLELGGENVLCGLDVESRLQVPAGICVDLFPGRRRDESPCYFLKIYGINDRFKDPVGEGTTFCNMPFEKWRSAMGVQVCEVWPDEKEETKRTLWNARLFPALSQPSEAASWLPLSNPYSAPEALKEAWRAAERYSPAEISSLADNEKFSSRRDKLRVESLDLSGLLRSHKALSAASLTYLLACCPDRTNRFARTLRTLTSLFGETPGSQRARLFEQARLLHAVGTSVARLSVRLRHQTFGTLFPHLSEELPLHVCKLLESFGLPVEAKTTCRKWSALARKRAWDLLASWVKEKFTVPLSEGGARLEPARVYAFSAPAWVPLIGDLSLLPPFAQSSGGSALVCACALDGKAALYLTVQPLEKPLLRITFEGKTVELSEPLIWPGPIHDVETAPAHRPGPEKSTGFQRFLSPLRSALTLAGLAAEIENGEHPTRKEEPSLWELLKRSGMGLAITVSGGPLYSERLGLDVALGFSLRQTASLFLGLKRSNEETASDMVKSAPPRLAVKAAAQTHRLFSGGVLLERISPNDEVPPVLCRADQEGEVLKNRLLLVVRPAEPGSEASETWIVAQLLDNDPTVITLLEEAARLAEAGIEALEKGDPVRLGRILTEADRLNSQLLGLGPDPLLQELLSRYRKEILAGCRITNRVSVVLCSSGRAARKVCKSAEARLKADGAVLHFLFEAAEGLAFERLEKA